MAQTHNLVQSHPSDLKDVVGKDQVEGEQELETVTKDVGEMESNLEGSEILSDGGATDEDQIAMDAAQDEDEDGDEKRVCVEQKKKHMYMREKRVMGTLCVLIFVGGSRFDGRERGWRRRRQSK